MNERISDFTASWLELDISSEKVREICNSNNIEMKSHILFYKDLPEEAINILKKDRHLEVKKAYAWTYATKEDLDTLILHRNNQVRWRAGANRNITEEQLHILIEQDDFLVNRNMACNVATPLPILEELMKNKNETISSIAKDNFKEKYFSNQCIKGGMNFSEKEVWNKAVDIYGLDCVINALDSGWEIKDICKGYIITTLNVIDLLNIPDNIAVDDNKLDIDLIDYIDEMRCFGAYKEKSPNVLATENAENINMELKELFESYDFHMDDAWLPIVSERNAVALDYLKSIANEVEDTELEEQARKR